MINFRHRFASTTVLVILTFQAVYVSAVRSVDILKRGSSDHGEDINSFISYRDLDKSPVLQKATIIFQTKLTDSSPLQDAALELLKTCKSAEDLSTPSRSSDSIKDAAKSTYAIKSALISQAAAGISCPATCSSFEYGSNQFTFFEAVKAKRRHDSIPTPSERSACVSDLWEKDNSWTSYSNGLQDANTLCQVPGLENAQRAILDLLSDMNSIIPEWLETMDEHQKAQIEFLRLQKSHVAQLDELQRRQRDDFEDHHEAAKNAVSSFIDDTKSHLSSMTTDLRQQLTSADITIEQMRKAVDIYILDFLILKDDQTRMFHAYESTFSDAVALQGQGLSEMQDVVTSVVQSVEHMYGGFQEQVRAVSEQFGRDMRSVMDLQDQFKESQETLLHHQSEAVEAERTLTARISHLKEDVEVIATTVGFLQESFGLVRTVWQGLQTRIGRAITLLLVLSGVSFACGQRRFAIIAAGTCGKSAYNPFLIVADVLAAITWLSLPFVQSFQAFSIDAAIALKHIVVFLGCEIFALGVMCLHRVSRLMPVVLDDRTTLVALQTACVGVALLSIMPFILLLLQRVGIVQLPEQHSLRKSVVRGSKPFAPINNSKLARSTFRRADSDDHSTDRFTRAMTLPPQKKSKWLA